MSRLRLSFLADKDLSNIAAYTIQNYGLRRARLYRDGLFKAFEIISDFPNIASDQNHIKANTRRHVHQFHAIYYRIDVERILILRILGPGEDPI